MSSDRRRVRIAITGSKGFTDKALFTVHLEEVLSHFDPESVELVTDMSPNLGRMVVDYAKVSGYPVKKFKADWKGLGQKAAELRDAEIGEYITHLMLFWNGTSEDVVCLRTHARQHKRKTKIVLIKEASEI